MNFGWYTDDETSFKLMDRYAELGGNFLDTADIYGKGKSEIIVGKWLATKRREDYVIATKAHFPMGSGPNDKGSNRKHLMDAVDQSLKRLQTTYIDIFQLHAYDKDTPFEETYTTLNDLVRSGKVRYVGVSNYRGYQLMKAAAVIKELRLEPIVCLQPLYNLLARQVEWEVLEAADQLGMGVIPWSPLHSGWLTGKYTREMTEPPKSTRVQWATDANFTAMSWSTNANETTWKVIDAVKEIATKMNKSISQVALKWVMQKSIVTAPIVGPRDLQQAEDNFAVFGWNLSQEDMDKLDQISKPVPPYPYNFVN